MDEFDQIAADLVSLMLAALLDEYDWIGERVMQDEERWLDLYENITRQVAKTLTARVLAD